MSSAVAKTAPPRPELHSLETEQAVLGAILLEPGRLDEVEIAPDIFHFEKHQQIARAILQLAAAGTAITIETVYDRLPAWGRTVEHFSYLAGLLAGVPTSAFIADHVAILRKHAVKRALVNAATEIAEIGHDSAHLTPERMIEKAAALLDPLKNNTHSMPADPWDPFRRTLADAYEARPPRQFVVEGLFPLPSLSIVYGAPGTLKSLLLADLALCVAAGLPWLEPLPGMAGTPFATKSGPVVWLDFDNGEARTDERFEAVGRARAIGSDIPLTYFSMPSPWLDASEPENVDRLIARVEDAAAALVVVDNLGVVSGDKDENSAQMTSVLANLRRLAESACAAVVVIHHQRKSNAAGGRAGDALRGHSSIEAALDLALLVEREANSEQITIKATKVRGADVLPFGAHFTFEHRASTKELASARFWQVVVEDTGSDRAIETAILDAVRGNAGINAGEVVKSVRAALPTPGMNRVRAILNQLAADGRKVREIRGERGAKRYELA